jgi:protein TonB
MKPKKSNKANLEKQKKLFFEIGMIVTLGLVFIAFEWGVNPEENKVPEALQGDGSPQEIIPMTHQDEKKDLPKPPPPPQPEKIDIVIDEVEIEDPANFGSTEVDPNEAVNPDDFEDNSTEESTSNVPFYRVQEKPQFNYQGQTNFRQYIANHLEFPDMARENGVSGTIYVKFIIDEDGNLINPTIMRGVDPALDNAVLKVLRNAPKWEPGKQNGKEVRVPYSIPIKFKLN